MTAPHDTGEAVRVPLFRGQDSRAPVYSVERGRAALADNTMHDSDSLRRVRGSKKLISSPMPASCYELSGLDTGILALTNPDPQDWNNTDGSQKNVGLGWGMKFLDIGGLTDDAGDNGQLVMVSHDVRVPGAPLAEVESVWIYVKMVTNLASEVVPGFRMVWGNRAAIEFDPSDYMSGGVSFDWDAWTWFRVHFLRNSSADTTTLSFWGRQYNAATSSRPYFNREDVVSGNRPWVFDRIRLGGRLTPKDPFYGVADSCHCLVTDVRLGRVASWGMPINMDGSWTRALGTDTGNAEVWPLDDAELAPVGLNGTKAYMIGGQAHREHSVPVAGSTDSLRFNGDSAIFLRDPAVLRETPKSSSNGGVPLHYLERPELSMGFWFKSAALKPFITGSLEDGGYRACLACWTTPYTHNFGVSTDPQGSSGRRPGEHLRIELVYDGTANWYLDAYFGELEPESLKHPDGTPGGSTSTTWPPGFSSDGYPPPTWNKPITMPGGTTGSALRIALGLETDTIHPMEYDWLVVVQRKFVAQGDGGNEINLRAYRYDPTTHALDATAGPDGDGEFYDETVGLSPAGTKSPANQSCYTALKQGVVLINPRTDVFAFTLGAACPGRYGDEKGHVLNLGWSDPQEEGIQPAFGVGSGFQCTDELKGFAFRGWISNFFALKRYLRQDERLMIARQGLMDVTMRSKFRSDLIYHLPFTETDGAVLREERGRDISYGTVDGRIFCSRIEDDPKVETPEFIGMFPRARPTWHNEAPQYTDETSKITAVIQRLDETGQEEIYVTGLPGLYRYDRTTHALVRLLTLPGQGGPERASVAIDHNDVIHIAGGRGRPVIITRNRIVALSGIDAPLYSAPEGLITQSQSLAGGVGVSFESRGDTNLDNLTLFTIDDGATVGFTIGYWSDVLKTRSAPGPTIMCRYSDPNARNQSTGSQPIYKYRVRVHGTLPLPRGFNASLVTHWEIFRTTSNGKVLNLEWRIPISSDPPDIYVGWKQDFQLGEEADHFRHPPPEGMRYIQMMGDRMYGVRTDTEPRAIMHTVLGDSTNWPPIYAKTLTQTQQPATGARVRRDRMFAFSRDYMYEMADSQRDTDPDGRIPRPVQLVPMANKAGVFNHDAIAEDGENGLYLPGNQSVFVTEGGVFRKVSKNVDSSGSAGSSWTWPDSWDLSDPDAFVSFHDERRNMVGICGPAADDSTRIDALLVFYEHTRFTADGRPFMVPECSRLKGIGVTAVCELIDPSSGHRQIWAGNDLGYLVRLGVGLSLGVDYEWLSTVTPKYGVVTGVLSTTVMRLDGSFSNYPDDLFRSSLVQVFRAGTEVSNARITKVDVQPSWVDVTTASAHQAQPGDTWVAGGLPMRWFSGQDDMGSSLMEKRVHSVDIRFVGSA